MQARKLKKILNTDYAVANNKEYISVGSPFCHNLFSVDKKTLKLSFALDTYKKGREYFLHKSDNKLLSLWDKLTEMIEDGSLSDIIDGQDTIKNPLPVFSIVDGKLFESVTDKYGWPNTDNNGVCMYENTHFSTPEEALKKGIRESALSAENHEKYAAELKENLKAVLSRLKTEQNTHKHLSAELAKHTGTVE